MREPFQRLLDSLPDLDTHGPEVEQWAEQLITASWNAGVMASADRLHAYRHPCYSPQHAGDLRQLIMGLREEQ